MESTQGKQPVQDPASEEGGLKRAIGPKLLLFFIVGDILGGGIYALVGTVGAETGGAIWIAFTLALVMAAFTAGSYAELVSKYPHAGGAGLYVHRAFRNPILSFFVAFAVAMSGITSASALSRAFGGDYLSEFVDIKVVLAALGLIVLIALINFRGIAESVRLNVGFTVVEIVGLLLIVLIAVVTIAQGDADVGRSFEIKEGSTLLGAALAGAALAFYALIGFEDSVNIAEEVKDPTRVYPKVLFGGLAIAGIVYLLVTIGASAVVPTGDLSGSSGPLLEVVKQGALGIDTKVFSAIGLLALSNGALINMIMASRLLYGMSREGVLPKPLSAVHSGRRTPWVAIIFTTLVAAGLIIEANLEKLAETTVALLLIVFTIVNGTVLYLRRDRVDYDHFKVFWPIPILGIGVSIALMTQIAGDVWARTGILLGIGAVLFAVNYLAVRRFGGGDARPTARS
ncbi:MAG: APC family permease [Actinomycetota bacterium]|nr:APC family permease [Actinomycetota bacterium]